MVENEQTILMNIDYAPSTYTSGQMLTAANLNNIETGIVNVIEAHKRLQTKVENDYLTTAIANNTFLKPPSKDFSWGNYLTTTAFNNKLKQLNLIDNDGNPIVNTGTGTGTQIDLSKYIKIPDSMSLTVAKFWEDYCSKTYVDTQIQTVEGKIPNMASYYTTDQANNTFVKKPTGNTEGMALTIEEINAKINDVESKISSGTGGLTQAEVEAIVDSKQFTSKNCFLASTQNITYTATTDNTTQITLPELEGKDLLAVIYKNLLLVQGVNYTLSSATTIALNTSLSKGETLYIVIGKTSYSYNDLTDKPVLPDGSVNLDNYYSKAEVDALVKELKDTIKELQNTTSSQSTEIAITNISLSPKSLSLLKAATSQLQLQITPDNATNKEVEWSSSKPEYVTVTNDGTVTGVAKGTAIITVKTKDSKFSDTCEITVEEEVDNTIHVTSMVIKPTDDFTMLTGKTRYLTPIIYPYNATYKTYTINNSDSSVISTQIDASSNLTITALKAGTAQLTLTTTDNANKSATIQVAVKDSFGYTDNLLLYDSQQLLGDCKRYDVIGNNCTCTLIASPLKKGITLRSVDCMRSKNYTGNYWLCIGTINANEFTITKLYEFAPGERGVWVNNPLSEPYVVNNENEYALLYNPNKIVNGIYDKDNPANANRDVLTEYSTISWVQTLSSVEVGTKLTIPNNSPKYDAVSLSFNIRYTD